MIVLGIDPGLRSTGLVGLDGKRAVYRGTIRTPSDWDDAKARDVICRDVLVAAATCNPVSCVVETYEYQGTRTHTENAIRCSLLVGEIRRALLSAGHIVILVERTKWGRDLGIQTDDDQVRRVARFVGLGPRNAHERDAACLAEWGSSLSRMKVAG